MGGEVEPCVVCGKLTDRLLFGDKVLGVHVCSRKCEHGYLSGVSSDSKEQFAVLKFLDESVLRYQKYDRVGWIVSGVGVVPIVLAFVFVNALLLVGGAVVVTVGTFSTRYFENRIYELTKTRKRVEI